MSGEIEDFNLFLQKVKTPAPMLDVSIDSPEVQKARDAFFADIKQAFEPHLSYLALDSATHVNQVTSPANGGETPADVSQELTLHDSDEQAIQMIASTFQTREHSVETVRFMIVPLNKFGNAALQSLRGPDEAFGDATFRG